MNLELLGRKAGKTHILGLSRGTTVFFALNGCTKEELRIKPVDNTTHNLLINF